MPRNTRVAILYLPAIHKGYVQFFEKNSPFEAIYLINPAFVKDHVDYLRKDIRALPIHEAAKLLKTICPGVKIQKLNKKALAGLNNSQTTIVMPEDDVSEVIEKQVSKAKVIKYPVFLRWDRRQLNKKDPVDTNRTVSKQQFDKKVMKIVAQYGIKATNLWRRVGAAIVEGDFILIISSNRQQPTQYSVYIDGDPRGISHKGSDIELTTDMHAEAYLIATAAKQGIALNGLSIYVSNFPCPNCAKLIANAGLSNCYYGAGYAVLDGKDVLIANGVNITHVQTPEVSGHPDTWVEYPKK